MMSFFGRRSTENCHHHSSYDRPFASRLPVVHSVDFKKSTDLNLPHPYDLHASKNTVQIHFDNAPIALTLTTRVAISIFAFSSWSRSVVIVVGHIDEDEGKGRCSSCKNSKTLKYNNTKENTNHERLRLVFSCNRSATPSLSFHASKLGPFPWSNHNLQDLECFPWGRSVCKVKWAEDRVKAISSGAPS